MLGLRGIRRDGASAGAHSDRFERFNIVVAILLAGWVPSILMLVVSYTILTNTLETKILRDRQTFVELVAHMVGDDLGRTGGIIEYYQTQPDIAKTLQESNAAAAAQQWVNDTFYSHPRIDGLFIVSRDGKLIASVPAVSAEASDGFSPDLWRDGATAARGAFVSPIHPRPSDGRRVTDIVGAVRAQDGTIVGYLGVSVLVERIGCRLARWKIHPTSARSTAADRTRSHFQREDPRKHAQRHRADRSRVAQFPTGKRRFCTDGQAARRTGSGARHLRYDIRRGEDRSGRSSRARLEVWYTFPAHRAAVHRHPRPDAFREREHAPSARRRAHSRSALFSRRQNARRDAPTGIDGG